MQIAKAKESGGNIQPPPSVQPEDGKKPEKTMWLSLLALGVVFGDIGTSPLYALKECFFGKHAIHLGHNNIMGVVSLIFWSLTVVVSIKYVSFILRVDNRGAGGIFALLGLTPSGNKNDTSKFTPVVLLAALFGAALLYGDGIITPAISVLSAIEGLSVATKAAERFVVPLTCIVLFLLFIVQKRGTARIGKIFGPIMVIWFVLIAILGVMEIYNYPAILKAVNPWYAVNFFAENHFHGFIVLGAVVLCITGGEALYADLGHFGRRSIRFSWFCVAYPALLLNYFGQGALLIEHPELAFNPFYGLVPKSLLFPMVGVSTIATVTASQALISGVFSLTQQAVQLGYCPRLRITHTSSEVEGQIYITGVNYALMLLCIGIVIAFGESSGLAGAYGIAVTATMCVTTMLYFVVITRTLHWPLWKALPPVMLFLIFDIAFFCSNLFKVIDGGWFTLLVAAAILILMKTWKDGRKELSRKLLASRFPINLFIEDVARHNILRVRGTAVFMAVSGVGTPSALMHHLKHNHMLHQRVIILSIRTDIIPSVAGRDRLKIEDLGKGFFRLEGVYGFMESPNVPELMEIARRKGLDTDPATTSYYLGRETLLTSGVSKMMSWRKALFAFMSRNASNATSYFGIPPNRVIELGAQIEL